MSLLPSYWKSVNLGDPKLADFFRGSILQIEEKIDGSQFSFGKVNGQLNMRSRSTELNLEAPEKLFSKSVNHLLSLNQDLIPDNVVFRGESVTSVRHNSNVYGRTPSGYIVLFGAEDLVTGRCFSHLELSDWANVFGIDVVPLLDTMEPDNMSGGEILTHLNRFLDRESYLGGCLVEGVAIKRLTNPIYYMDKPIFAKLVSASFKETQKKDWRKDNPTQLDALHVIAEEVGTPARYEKAIQRLKESGKFTGAVQDIGPLIKAVGDDIREECKEFIGARFAELFTDDVSRIATKGIPNWYKKKLQDNLASEIGEPNS